MKHRPDIDGLRAVAIISVLLFHADIGCTGGFVGVDVFFVLSGFLITGLILKDLNRDRFSIAEFWERRVRRIMPALTVVLFATVIAGWFLLLGYDFEALGKSVVAQAMLLSNVYFWRGSGYFARIDQETPLLHTWSLAVEEQFYLLFPLVLLAVRRFWPKRLVAVILSLSVVSFGLSVYWSYYNRNANFYLLPSRAWELLLGAFLAAWSTHQISRRWLAEILSWSGLIAILWAVFQYDRNTRFPGASAILPCLGTAFLIHSNRHSLTSIGKLLSLRPVVFVGLISYSLYLWHWPVLVFAEYWSIEPLPRAERLLLLLFCVVLAALSWKFVETPFRQRTVCKTRPQVFAFAGASACLLLASGLAVYWLQGLPVRMPEKVRQYADGRTARTHEHDLTLEEALDGDLPQMGIADSNAPVRLLLWGDSHAMSVVPVLEALCREYHVRGLKATHFSTAPLIEYVSRGKYSMSDDSLAFSEAIIKVIRKACISDVVLAANWSRYLPYGGTGPLNRGLLATVAALNESGVRVWILKQVPSHRWNVPKALASAAFQGEDPEKLTLPAELHQRVCKMQRPIFEGISGAGVSVLDPAELFLNDAGDYRAAVGGKPLYFDDDHLSIHGALLLRPLLEPIFRHGTTSQAAVTRAGVAH